ncbi:hypothetical protein TNCV_1564101 [Trichonephila clavipes]|nr:hypothetical protein TNCV_1564101 [Trichonephila clavipes]
MCKNPIFKLRVYVSYLDCRSSIVLGNFVDNIQENLAMSRSILPDSLKLQGSGHMEMGLYEAGAVGRHNMVPSDIPRL